MSSIYAKYHLQFMLLPYLFIQYYNLRNSVINSHVFIFVELLCFVGQQIGFEVLVFGPAGPNIEPGRCAFLSILFSEFSFSSWISWFQNLEIFPPFLRNSCNKIISWFWVTIATVIFTCRYFKLRWNTSALSQSNGRNFSGSSITIVIGKKKFIAICDMEFTVDLCF